MSIPYLQSLLKKLVNKDKEEIFWFCAKFYFIRELFSCSKMMLNRYTGVPAAPSGICTFFPCATESWNIGIEWFIAAAWIISFLYIFEKKMLFSVFFLALFSTFAFTLEVSNGVLGRNGIFSGILWVQFFVYFTKHFKPNFNLKKNRLLYTLQVIAACYVLSAISKISTAGLFGWAREGKYIAIQILKNHKYEYVSTGEVAILQKGQELIEPIIMYPNLIEFILFSSLLLELFAFLMPISKKTALIYGLLLRSMHFGIFIIMDIHIASFVMSLTAFAINPIYYILILLFFLLKKIFPQLAAPAS